MEKGRPMLAFFACRIRQDVVQPPFTDLPDIAQPCMRWLNSGARWNASSFVRSVVHRMVRTRSAKTDIDYEKSVVRVFRIRC
jgi:hypothetical protein